MHSEQVMTEEPTIVGGLEFEFDPGDTLSEMGLELSSLNSTVNLELSSSEGSSSDDDDEPPVVGVINFYEAPLPKITIQPVEIKTDQHAFSPKYRF